MKVRSNSPLQDPPVDYSIAGAQNKWFTITEGPDLGKKMYYYDYTPENHIDKVVVFVHGNPECSYTYRSIRDELVSSDDSIRIVAMDHIGFGISDRATHEMIDVHHASNLRLLMEHLDLQNIYLVIHDWGGPIGIGSVIHQPERVKGLIVLNTTVFPMPKAGYTYQKYPFRILPWCMTPKLMPNAVWGGVAGYIVTHASPQGFLTFVSKVVLWCWRHVRKTIQPDQVEYVWSQMLRDKMNALSSKRQVLQTPVWGHGYQYTDKSLGSVSNFDFYKNIQTTLSDKWKNISVAGFFGMWDPCGKQEVIDQWRQALPQIENHIFQYPEEGHFIEEAKGQEIGKKILSMLSE